MEKNRIIILVIYLDWGDSSLNFLFKVWQKFALRFVGVLIGVEESVCCAGASDSAGVGQLVVGIDTDSELMCAGVHLK